LGLLAHYWLSLEQKKWSYFGYAKEIVCGLMPTRRKDKEKLKGRLEN
jgi:hypothetical protein